MKVYGNLLTADADTRVLSYRLLPYGEPGRTSLGTVTASAGTLALPEDPTTLVANLEHDPTRPIGRFVSLDEDEGGLNAAVRVAPTTAGNDLLTEAAEGLRTGISVEIDHPVIRNGALLGGTLTGAGFVTRPAFPSAQLVAADAGDLPESLEINGAVYTRTDTTTDEADGAPDEAASAADKESKVTENITAAAPQGLQAAASPKGNAFTQPRDAYAALAAASRAGGEAGLLASLTDITHGNGTTGVGTIAAAPEWLGEVWGQTTYVRKYIPLIASGALTSWNQKGFRFTGLPVVAKYAGNKGAVPSTGIGAEAVSYAVQPWANAADIDRRFVDFNDQDVIAAWVEANANSYKKVTDLDTLASIVTASETETPGAVPTGVDAGIAAIVDGALALIADGFTPTATVVGVDLYRSILLTPKDQVAEYLTQAFGLKSGDLEGFAIVPSGEAEVAGKVVVLDGSTLRLKEFGGGAPIRVDAINVANGGVDIGVFGYTSFQKLVDGGSRILTVPAPDED